ncbi:methyltransferase [Vibrio porteresiae]|uniref:Ribosomal RNA large subunit methyltransferase G n=1 Tax=Vibrio porteresiae DSM 19223 TaxID=1123496 RepID=A0ABZ0QE33_9VIBR|nr:methyltransferase [Vibrio porteresiae]WPC74714.1 methyltransferase [Vibrio porteresiae DSM 19223]
MTIEFSLHQRTLTLHRYPVRSNDTLQAWDAGDEYLINHIEEMALPDGLDILILNDQFGALSCWFSAKHQVTVMSDSYLAHQGITHNLQQNHCPAVTLLTTMDAIPNKVDLVLMQIPRNNRHLTWQLSQLRQAVDAKTPIIAVNKAKEIHSSTLNLFSQYLGNTTTSLAWKKHRLVFSFADCSPVRDVSPDTVWPVAGEQIELNNLPNVYSGENLDQGARFLLEHLPTLPELAHFIDLGCGNGVLSVKMGQLNPQAAITCVDESFMAVESARQNLVHNLGNERDIECVANNCLDQFDAGITELVLCNPPFHQQQAITDHIAWQMFCDAKQVLKKGGKLLVIGNRHLRYDIKLSRLFGKSLVKTVAGNQKFVILEAIKG